MQSWSFFLFFSFFLFSFGSKEGGSIEYVPPLPGGRNGADGAQLLVDAHQTNVGVRLDAGRATGPGPRGRPNSGAVRDRVDIRALRARGGGGRAPVVLVDGEGRVIPLVVAGARRGASLEVGGSRGLVAGGGEGARRGQHEGGDLGGALHFRGEKGFFFREEMWLRKLVGTL